MCEYKISLRFRYVFTLTCFQFCQESRIITVTRQTYNEIIPFSRNETFLIINLSSLLACHSPLRTLLCSRNEIGEKIPKFNKVDRSKTEKSVLKSNIQHYSTNHRFSEKFWSFKLPFSLYVVLS